MLSHNNNDNNNSNNNEQPEGLRRVSGDRGEAERGVGCARGGGVGGSLFAAPWENKDSSDCSYSRTAARIFLCFFFAWIPPGAHVTWSKVQKQNVNNSHSNNKCTSKVWSVVAS